MALFVDRHVHDARVHQHALDVFVDVIVRFHIEHAISLACDKQGNGTTDTCCVSAQVSQRWCWHFQVNEVGGKLHSIRYAQV